MLTPASIFRLASDSRMCVAIEMPMLSIQQIIAVTAEQKAGPAQSDSDQDGDATERILARAKIENAPIC